MVCKRQEQCVFGEKCSYHVGSVLPKCSIFEQKPPIKQTEQEYLQTCNTEQLAEWIVRIVDCEFCPVKKPCKKQPCKKQIEMWLKQPHRGDGE